MQAQQTAEVLRMPLQSLCLSVKVCLPHSASIQQALSRLLSPPAEQAIAAAVQSLKVCTMLHVSLREDLPNQASSCVLNPSMTLCQTG